MCCVARCTWTDMLSAASLVFKRSKSATTESVSWTGSNTLYTVAVYIVVKCVAHTDTLLYTLTG